MDKLLYGMAGALAATLAGDLVYLLTVRSKNISHSIYLMTQTHRAGALLAQRDGSTRINRTLQMRGWLTFTRTC